MTMRGVAEAALKTNKKMMVEECGGGGGAKRWVALVGKSPLCVSELQIMDFTSQVMRSVAFTDT